MLRHLIETEPSAGRPPHPARAKQHGFVGFEIALALVVLAIGAYLGFTGWQKLQQRACGERFADEVRVLSAALENCHRKLGKWPAAAREGEVPEGIAVYLSPGKWPDTTPIGGRYVWTPPTAGRPATLEVTAFGSDAPLTAARADLRAIDLLLDDGNLTTGRFRTGFNGWPVWRVSP